LTVEKKYAGGNGSALDIFVRAAAFVFLIDLLIIVLPASVHDAIFRELQVLLPVPALLLALRVYFVSRDNNVRLLCMAISFYFAASMISNVAWYMIPDFVSHPFFQKDLYYYIGGFGWLIGYAAILYALYVIKNSRQWYISPDLDRRMNTVALCSAAIFIGFVLAFIRWDSPKLVDVFLLVPYVLADIAILTQSAKLIGMKLRLELKFIVIAISLYIIINLIGDLIFEARWLFDLDHLWGFPVSDVTNFVYNTALMFMAVLLFLYSSDTFKARAVEGMRKRLKDTQLFVDDIIQQSPDAMCIFDRHGKVALANDAFFRIFGLKRNDLDRAFNIFSHIDSMIETEKELGGIKKAMAGETVIIPKLRIHATSKRKEYYIYAKMFPTFASDGSIASYVLIMEDITERVKLEDDLFKAYNALKEEYEWKMDFTNAAAHELRTPLTPILGYSQILKLEVQDEKHRKYLEAIERNALRQKDIVNRMLELASLDAGAVRPRYCEFSIWPILQEIAENYKPINPNIHIHANHDLVVCSDPEILAHVLDNLASNAVKYSASDRDIDIRVEDAGDTCLFSVQDHGIGIPREEWDRIFERFYIVDGKKDTRVTGRIGLGLPVVKSYLALVGGEVWLESEPGKGSTFYFTIPKHHDENGEVNAG
jgi:PAS domain S-box-containing protein